MYALKSKDAFSYALVLLANESVAASSHYTGLETTELPCQSLVAVSAPPLWCVVNVLQCGNVIKCQPRRAGASGRSSCASRCEHGFRTCVLSQSQ